MYAGKSWFAGSSLKTSKRSFCSSNGLITLFPVQDAHSFEQVQSLVQLVIVLGTEFGNLDFLAVAVLDLALALGRLGRLALVFALVVAQMFVQIDFAQAEGVIEAGGCRVF